MHVGCQSSATPFTHPIRPQSASAKNSIHPTYVNWWHISEWIVLCILSLYFFKVKSSTSVTEQSSTQHKQVDSLHFPPLNFIFKFFNRKTKAQMRRTGDDHGGSNVVQTERTGLLPVTRWFQQSSATHSLYTSGQVGLTSSSVQEWWVVTHFDIIYKAQKIRIRLELYYMERWKLCKSTQQLLFKRQQLHILIQFLQLVSRNKNGLIVTI